MLLRLMVRFELESRGAGDGPPAFRTPFVSSKPRVQKPLDKGAAPGATVGLGGTCQGARKDGPGLADAAVPATSRGAPRRCGRGQAEAAAAR